MRYFSYFVELGRRRRVFRVGEPETRGINDEAGRGLRLVVVVVDAIHACGRMGFISYNFNNYFPLHVEIETITLIFSP